METRRLAVLGAGEPPDQLLLRARMGIVNVLAHWGHIEVAAELCAETHRAQVRASTCSSSSIKSRRHTDTTRLPLQADQLGAEHPDTMRSLMNLAGLAGEVGDLVRARELTDQVHALQEATLGPDHPDVLLTRYENCKILNVHLESLPW